MEGRGGISLAVELNYQSTFCQNGFAYKNNTMGPSDSLTFALLFGLGP